MKTCHDCVISSVFFTDSETFHDLWKGNTDVVPISSSLKCTLKLTIHEWVDVFLCIAQSERLEQIKVSAEIIEVLISNVTIH